MEIWKPIAETNGMIEVSNEGNVRSYLRGTPRTLRLQEDQKGYLRVSITIEREKRTFKVHREVAKAFVENPKGLPQVNHIDGNKKNNSAVNLEWVSNIENAHHAIENGLWTLVIEGSRRENERRKKPVIAQSGTHVIRFESVSEAERYFDSRHISDVLKGKRSMVKGYTFRYAERG